MKMRKKVFVIVAVLAIIIFAAIYVIVDVIILRSYADLENREVNNSVARTLNAWHVEIAEINSRVSDWAFWDDTYSFVQDRNENYINLNLGDSSFINLRLNLMLFINATGQLVYGKAFDLDNSTETSLPQGINEEIVSKPVLWNHTTEESMVEGVVLLQEESLLLSSKPILTSQKEGPIMGALLMARYVDSREIAYLSNTTRFPLSVNRFNDPQIEKDFHIARSSLSNAAPIFVEPLNADFVGGYALVNDVYSNPALILRIDLPRDIYKLGLSIVTYLIAMIATLCAIFGTALIILLEKGILSPLTKLTRIVEKMGTEERSLHASARLGTDEMSILAEAIKNAMSQRLAAIEELAGMVGHDLRNPLTGINGAAYYLKTKYASKLDAKGKEMLKIIEDDVAYSNKIINDLLEYSRKLQLQYVDTTPKTLTKQALSVVSIPGNVRLIDLTENETEMAVDTDKMRRVFVNLIKNGIDAMPEGGSLTIKSTRTSGGVIFTFSDTGRGMSEETLRKIFTPLFTTKAKGMGLGLSICKRFVEAHGGSISFESSTGKGTAATIFIPAKTKAETKDEIWVELPTLDVYSTMEDPS